MGFQVVKLQNASGWADQKPTIEINKDDDGWEEAYKQWLAGRLPTNSQEWKKGVFALTEGIK